MGACVSTEEGEHAGIRSEAAALICGAAKRGDAAAVQTLLTQHPNSINVPDGRGWTALHYAARHGHLECVKLLLAHGANVRAAHRALGSTPVHSAAIRGQEACLRALVEGGGDASAASVGRGWAAMHCAASQGHLSTIKYLAAVGVDVTAPTKHDQKAPFDLAMAHGHPEAATLLLELAAQQAAARAGTSVTAGQGGTPAAALAKPAAAFHDAAAPEQHGLQRTPSLELAEQPSAPATTHSLVLEERASAPAATSSLMADAFGRGDTVTNSADGLALSGSLSSDPLLLWVSAQLAEQQRGGAPPPGGGMDVESFRAWELPFSDLQIQRLIGAGSFGKVYLATYQETAVAVKILHSGVQGGAQHALSLSHPALRGMGREAAVMAGLHHPNCINLMGICSFPAAIVTEYCERGSLTQVLQQASSDAAAARELTWPRRLALALGVAKGLLYLHTRSPPILHRDLKSPNLLIDEGWRIRVADFNLSKAAEMGSQLSTALDLNPRWLAPEVLSGARPTAASDAFSYGVVLWELLTWRLPWDTTALTWQIAAAVAGGKRLEVPPREALPGDDTPQFGGLQAYVALMQRCMAQDPEERPTFADIIPALRQLAESADPAQQAAAVALGPGTPAASARECRICMQAADELLVLVPCGHRAACAACTALLLDRQEQARSCPICRTKITAAAPGTFRIFSC